MGIDTIYALSSGSLPAAIGVVRISGPHASAALQLLAGRVPEPRRASLVVLRHPNSGEVIDKALSFLFPGPGSATGDDLVELHIHGGRAVAAFLLSTLSTIPGLRPAEPGAFTRRAFENGRMDLTEVEGLGDLLAAETEWQRRSALALAGGGLSRTIEEWQRQLLVLSAQLEARLDFADEGEIGEGAVAEDWGQDLCLLSRSMADRLSRPAAERLRDGIRVVIAGPPNAGKSTLLNWLAGREAAITSAVAGTTRDVVEAPTALEGRPFLLIDTAGLRESEDEVEAIGIERARQRIADADILIWLGQPSHGPAHACVINIQPKSDLVRAPATRADADLHVSPVSGENMDRLVEILVSRAERLLPREGEAALHSRHRDLLAECLGWLGEAKDTKDIVVAAEALRQARQSLDRLTGRAGVENMLDMLFAQFCIGK